MMKVLYDDQMFRIQKLGGITRYFAYLYHHLPNEQVTVDLGMLYTRNLYLQDAPLPLQNTMGRLLVGKHFQQVNRWYSKYLIRSGHYDVLHPTYYDPYLLREAAGKPIVVTVHDLIHQLFPQYFRPGDPTSRQQHEIIPRADRIIAISENTKRDILRFFPVDERKITVIHHGLMLGAPQMAGVLPSSQGADYLLYVGERGIYKNFARMVEGVAPLLHKYGLRLICAGSRPFSAEEQAMLARFGIAEQVEQRRVSDVELRTLYHHAVCFVFPSLYEGFGLPILEAFAAGCPVVLSESSCFPEIAGEAGVYFDPLQSDSIGAAVQKVADDRALRERMVSVGKERLGLFDANDMVRKTRDLYLSLA